MGYDQPHLLQYRQSVPLSVNPHQTLQYHPPTTLSSCQPYEKPHPMEEEEVARKQHKFLNIQYKKSPAVEMEQEASALPTPEPTYSIWFPTHNEYSSFMMPFSIKQKV